MDKVDIRIQVVTESAKYGRTGGWIESLSGWLPVSGEHTASFPTFRDSRKCKIMGRLENLPYTQMKPLCVCSTDKLDE